MTAHPSLPGRLADASVADSDQSWPVARSEAIYDSPYISLRNDTIVDPSGDEHPRAVVQPNGAVGVLAIDEDDRVLLVEQYRHPVGRRLLELPAGTLDVAGEEPLEAAVRELAEEADIIAGEWTSMLHLLATPGYSTERWEVFRATDLRPVPEADRTEREAEEADMIQWWLPFDQALAAVLDGRITDSMTVSGILAAHALRHP
ncbi:NUDIX domain-containing protein [Aeromicrobium chenweiae]|uniref:ADP-ribose pyrophosphatase n=1 Tax=Aeromicrobium chenweiae TaxID=2079793 RepID=A0A2S0WME9_9ACTN|nr:NUDIX hydrolase [Aeromicrobium chenweiae]AWB92486.1 ADP-ribose pyrophosphatase [Aeromicrobium chenweiae]TGN31223.1 NUDIX hydrolase [Aeromicrobium chenweiae]